MFSIKKIIKSIISYPSLFMFRKGNNNKNFTMLSNNCVSGILYNQYGLKFLSPTINTFIDIQDFIYFCSNLKSYVDGYFIEKQPTIGKSPLGQLIPIDNSLPPINVHFIHYDSFDEGVHKWEERKRRINWNNIYVSATCTTINEEESLNDILVSKFNSIPYKKMVFVTKNLGFCCEYSIKSNSELFRKKRFSWKYGFNAFHFNKFLRQ